MVEKDRGQYTFDMFAALAERTIKRLWIIIILLIVLLAATNGAWIHYTKQFETVETWQDVYQSADGDGTNNFIGGDYNGYAEDQNQNEEARP